MGSPVKRYKKLSNEVIRKGFPFLKKRKFVYLEKKLKVLGRVWNLGFFDLIEINPILRGFSDKELKGFFAHEISHVERHKQRGWIKKISFVIGYLFSKKFRRWEERGADRRTIERGYRSELYALMKKSYSISKWHEKRLKSSHLSLKEIKQYRGKNK
jgi:hypothetical protein